MLMYVDNTDFIIMGKKEEITVNVINWTQTFISNWQVILWTLGRALKPTKCNWSLILFKWDKGKQKYNTSSNSNKIKVQNSEENEVGIK